MPYQFPPDVDHEISLWVASGRFNSPDEVLREALRALKRHDAEVIAIQEGIDDMEAGRTSSLRDFDRRYRVERQITD